MESIINTLSSNPVFLIIFVILVIIIIFSIVKRLFKLLIPLIILVGLYAGYLYNTGQNIPTTKEDIIKHGKEKIEVIKDKGEKILKDKVKKEIDKKVK
ncbi:MAG: hypothetical protein U9Q27_03290 [Patescibacteria group bacterium]|nr:hypothetical protein [Patescibacteria group bacterium]